jgi:hypothetical protein
MASGTKLTRLQEQTVSALLTEITIARTAQKVGVGESSIRRWLALPAFKKAYDQARASLLQETLAGLIRCALSAVGALQKNLTCGKPAAENSAARTLLEMRLTYENASTLEERLQRLEAAEALRQKEKP